MKALPLFLCCTILFGGITGCAARESREQIQARLTAQQAQEKQARDAGILAEVERKESLREQAQTADCGPYPQNYQELTKQYITANLKDPSSAKYRLKEKPRKTYFEDTLRGKLSTGETIFCWIVHVDVNAKNSFGAYAGFQTWQFYIRDGRIIKVAIIS
jgi:hypothetical protein